MAISKPHSCQLCNKSFKTSAGAHAHTVDVHYFQCPECPKRFESITARDSHQQSKQHFQCARCQHASRGNSAGQPTAVPPMGRTLPRSHTPLNCKIRHRDFSNGAALASHQNGAQTMSFRCLPCNRDFVDEAALRQHLQDKKHSEPKQRPGHICEECNKGFPTGAALKQHRQSTVHKPLSNLNCVGETCRLTFKSPSALLQHLEGGHCSSGWTREKINSTVHKFDKSRILTNSTISLATMFTSMTTSTSVSTFSDLVIPTPSEWSEIEDDELMEDSLISLAGSLDNELSCPLCLATGRPRVFKDTKALSAHMSSAAHAEKAFKCPRAFTNAKFEPPYQRTKMFTTLSGLTQHLESGQCVGGMSTLWKTLDFLQKDVLQFSWPGKLLQS